MEMPLLRYTDLSKDAIKAFHTQYGALQVELGPTHGKFLRAFLDQRSRLESSVTLGTNHLHIFLGYIAFTFYECLAYVFHRKLLLLEKYVKAVDAAHGYDISKDGNDIFLLAPIAKKTWKNETPIQCQPGG